MASVSSLDKDLKNLRFEKYTPQRSNEARQWIESALGESLGSGDLLDELKDGVALCKLVNAVLGPGTIRFKQSPMPFIQMEQISHFLRACQSPPLNLPPHDCFLTVDLYEQKDPAQVLQCIGSFSRRAAALSPTQFPTGIGGTRANTSASPQASGAVYNSPGGRRSPTKEFTASPPGSSTWSKKSDVHSTAPAWNIAQYGWTGGASQGNQGVTFGGRRQIVSSQPQVPSLAEKEKRRRDQEAEEVRQAEEERRRRQAQVEEEERLAAEEDARKLDEEKQRREAERSAAEEEKRRWEAEEKRWKEEEEQRLREEAKATQRSETERNARPKLQGQYLSQYKADQTQVNKATAESDRIMELERKLAEAEERERKYEAERLKRQQTGSSQPSITNEAPPAPVKQEVKPPVEDEWSQGSERSFLRQQWNDNQAPSESRPLPNPGSQAASTSSARPLPVPGAQASKSLFSRPLPVPGKKPVLPTPVATSGAAETTLPDPPRSPRPLPDPATYSTATTQAIDPPVSHRPLPDPTSYAPQTQPASRTDNFLAANPAPAPPSRSTVTPKEAAFDSGAERAVEDARRAESQQKTKAGGWAAKSLIEREMERDLERAREWEESQKATREAAAGGHADADAGSAPGQGFNTSQYGFLGGDNLNKGGGGVFSGRRQIMGPRTMGQK